MAVLPIIEYPDPRLRLPCGQVESFGDKTQRLVDDLLETLYATPGIGLSAPQIAVLQQIIVMDCSESRDTPEVLINPEILSRSTYGFVQESCLSVPGIEGNVIRATELRLRAQDRHGQPLEQDVSGIRAVCIQHELDHLEGKLFIDRFSFLKRLAMRVSGSLRRSG